MTPIAPHITAFLRERLPLERGASDQTCESYAGAGMLARATLAREALTEKLCQMRSKGCHRVFSLIKRSHAWAMSFMSCGELSKYQYVLPT